MSSSNQFYLNKKTPQIQLAKENKFYPPKVMCITQQNKLEVIKAANPKIIKNQSGSGIPFFTNIGINEGLPVNNIICSVADKLGNLWFGTGSGGVSRYDGKTFKNYTIAQGLAGNVVFNIIEDKKANLWFATTSGVSKYDGKKFINYTTSEGLADNFVTCIMEDQIGNIWFGTHQGGVSKYDGKRFVNYTSADGLADNYVRCMLQDTKGKIWFGTDGGGVSNYDGNKFVTLNKAAGLANNNVNCIAQDKAGNLWLGTNAGVSKYDGIHFINYTTIDGLADNNVFCIFQDNGGNLWFGTHTKGVSKYDGNSFLNYSKTEGLADNKINSILQDIDGNIWISSQGGGVSIYQGNSFTNFTTAQGLAANLVFWIMQDNSGNIWFATYEGGASKFDGKKFKNYTKAQGLADNKIWSIIQDMSGNIWFGTDRGVSKFDGISFINFTTKQGLASDAVITIMEDKAGNIWFGTRNNGVSKFDGKCIVTYTTLQGLGGNNIWGIVQDSTGNIWFATHDGGLSKFDGKVFTNYTIAQGLPTNALSAILQDKAGNIWLGTDGKGACKFDGKDFITYTSDQGLADNSITNIAEDKTRNIIWFGTTQGLSGLKGNHSKDIRQENMFENFTKLNGSPLKDVSTGALLVDNTGIVWVGSGEGKLLRFNYSAVYPKNSHPLNLKIQSLKINNENICWNNLLESAQERAVDSLTLLNEMFTSFGKILPAADLQFMKKKYSEIKFDGVSKNYPVPINLMLPYNYNNISFDFVAIEPAMQKQVKYQFKLEGYSKEWSPLTNSSTAVFGNINAGYYTFKVQALSPFGIWSETQLSFQILPPWWTSWWAYILYAVLTGGTGFVMYRNHILGLKRIQAKQILMMLATQEDERKRISKDLHDDIGARLTNINILSALGQQTINNPQEALDYLKLISNEIQMSVEALDDIVWSIDIKNNSMEEFTDRIRRYTADVFDRTSIRYTIECEEQALNAKLSMGQPGDLFLVFKELINNIQKHAKATEVIIIIGVKDSHLLMQIKDNGKGFDPDLLTNRNGLKNIQQRMQKWEGSSSIQSSPGQGAMVIIILPVLTPSLKRGMWARFTNW